jgi:hypothetical protein
LRQWVVTACDRLQTELAAHSPVLSRKVTPWMTQLSPTGEAADYFLQPNSFPLLPLIGWAATSFAVGDDQQFVRDVVYSTASMYYYIRLLDNVMDGHGTIEAAILPALAFFHTEFQSPYQRYFPSDHPFWRVFRSAWIAGNDAVAQELELNSFGADDFETVSVAKLSAARIPVAAVAFRANAQQQLAAWDAFTVALSRWSQMEDDLFDWHHDLRHGKSSYFLSEAKRNSGGAGSVEAWIVQNGFEDGVEKLTRELFALRQLAETLHSTDIFNYLDCRKAMLEGERVRIAAAFKTLAEMADITESRCSVSNAIVPE